MKDKCLTHISNEMKQKGQFQGDPHESDRKAVFVRFFLTCQYGKNLSKHSAEIYFFKQSVHIKGINQKLALLVS